jgi:SH3-like domain-containing protein
MKGKVNANLLNIRSQPSTTSDVIGKLKKDDVIEIVQLQGEWYEIKYQDSSAFVAAKFIVEMVQTGAVNANLLNIRSLPNMDAEKIGQLTKDQQIAIVDTMDQWYKIKFNDGFGYVYSQYVDIKTDTGEKTFLFQDKDLLIVPLEPAQKIPEAGNRIQTIVKSTYNKYGNLLSVLSKKLGIDLAASIAVLSVESGGVGIDNGRVLIRFENHLFYKYWGKDNEAVYNQHFKFDPGKNWLGHQFREDVDGDWVDFHGDQSGEYDALNFARSLDDEKALLSISMGLPQILGSNSKLIGYDTVTEMFNNFNKDIRYHIFALFDFFSPRMIKFLRSKDFVSFAMYYNGQGQAQRYGKFIQDYYEAFPKNVT